MAEDAGDAVSEGRLDLVPMIDCIMLLLIFLILTTKFNVEEKAIGSLLPTDKGQLAVKPQKQPEPRKEINIIIVPKLSLTERWGGPDIQPSMYQKEFESKVANINSQAGNTSQALNGLLFADGVYMRIGQNAPLPIERFGFDGQKTPAVEGRVKSMHTYIHEYLTKMEEPGKATRAEQLPVNIHCFSGLSWGYALVAYDAVRKYEADRAPSGASGDVRDMNALKAAREVTFAPPRIRQFSKYELGYELDDMMRMQ